MARRDWYRIVSAGSSAEAYPASMGFIRAAPALTAAVLCTACAGGGASPLACTEIGAEPGVSVTVGEDMADAIENPVLEVCIDGCRTYQLELHPGSETVDLGCDSDEPDGSCAGSARPNGTLVGFVSVDGLTAEEIGVTVISGGQYYRTAATPEVVYPNGRGCPGEALQLSLTLDRGALSA